MPVNQNYDPEIEDKGAAKSPSPFSNSTSGGGASFSRGDELDPVRRAEKDGGFWKPQGDSTGSRSNGAETNPTSGAGAAEKPGQISSREEDPNSLGNEGGFTRGNMSSTSKTKSKLRSTVTRRRAIIGGGAIAGIGGTGVVIFFMLVPLKIETMVTNLEHRFFSSSENAVENETESMFRSYIKRVVGPNLTKKGCGDTIDKNCTINVAGNGNNPVTNLYKTWSQARLENTLAKSYGIEFRYDSASKTYYMKAPGLGGKNGEEAISKPGEGSIDDSMFVQVDRGTIRQSVKDALANETRWKQVMYRYKIGRLLEEKYGIRRCIVFCGVKDALANHIDAQKKAAQLYLVQRVITPRTQAMGIAMECLLQPGCEPTDNEPNADPNAPAINGGDEDEAVQVPVSNGLRTLANSYGVTDEAAIQALQKTLNDMSDKGFQKWLITEGLTKAGVNATVAEFAAGSLPVIGWLNSASNIVHSADGSSTELKKLRYVVNASAAVSLYMMYRTYADEIHTGHVTASEVGSMSKALEPGNNGSKSDPEMGGTASADATPLYNNLFNGTGASDGSSKGGYMCNNKSPVPKGKLVCDEESLGGGSSLANSIHDFLHLPGVGVITTIANVWHSTVGAVFNFATGLLGNAISGALNLTCVHILGAQPLSPLSGAYCQVKGLVGKAIPIIQQAVTQWLIPNPFSSNMSGGRTFDMMAAGADVSGSVYAQNGLGGRKLTTVQAANITNTQLNEEQRQFSQQSFFARMFSTASPDSFVSKLAMDMPFGNQTTIASSFSSMLSSPLATLGHGFGSIFSEQKIDAVSPTQGDAFGVPQYGYTDSDLASIGDPETYWDNNCTDDASQGYQKDNSYNLAAAGTSNADPDTGTPLNTTTNPCMLIKESVGAAGGYFDESNLTQDDLADVNGGTSSSSASSAGGFTNPFPDGWTPSRLDMGYDGHFTKEIVSPCDGNVIYYVNSQGPHSWEGDYVVVQCSSAIPGLPSNAFYFAEGITATVKSGPVTAGQQIAVPGPTGFSEGPGGIEFGLADPNNPGNALAESGVSGMNNCSAASKSMVLNFAKWAEQNLHIAPPASTDQAGCA